MIRSLSLPIMNGGGNGLKITIISLLIAGIIGVIIWAIVYIINKNNGSSKPQQKPTQAGLIPSNNIHFLE